MAIIWYWSWFEINGYGINQQVKAVRLSYLGSGLYPYARWSTSRAAFKTKYLTVWVNYCAISPQSLRLNSFLWRNPDQLKLGQARGAGYCRCNLSWFACGWIPARQINQAVVGKAMQIKAKCNYGNVFIKITAVTQADAGWLPTVSTVPYHTHKGLIKSWVKQLKRCVVVLR